MRTGKEGGFWVCLWFCMSVRFSVCDCVPAGVESDQVPEQTDRNTDIHSKRGDPQPEDTGEIEMLASRHEKGRAVPLSNRLSGSSSSLEERIWERGPGLQKGRGYREKSRKTEL